MSVSWKLGRVAGIDVYLHPSFLLILLFPQVIHGGLFGLTLVLAGFGCVLLHELGHALMARRFGIGTQDITLYIIGGVARLTRMPRAPGAELLIALAGPAVNIAIVAGLLAFDFIGLLGPFVEFAESLLVLNLVLAGFNMIPAFPMDGGRVFRALLSGLIGRVRATAIAAGLGQVLAVSFGVFSLLNFMWLQVFLAAFIFMAARMELAGVIAEDLRRRFDGDSGVWTAPAGYHWIQQGNGAWQLAPIAVRVNDRRYARWN